MMHEQINKELLSALVDGELRGPELEQALACAESAQGCASWELYHLIGDVLRSPDLAHHSQHDLLSGLRVQMAQQPLPLQEPVASWPSGALEQVAPALGSLGAGKLQRRDPAANASVFRWKVAAGFATVAAVAALGWNLMGGPVGPMGAQLANAGGATGPGAAAVVAVASENGEILRDPRLDALLASHQQYANRPALQLPAEFLRNASLAGGAKPSPMVTQ